MKTLPPSGSFPSLLNMDAVADVLRCGPLKTGPGLLIKIIINPATEVVRLTDPGHLAAEADLLRRLEVIIGQEFEDGEVYQLAFNAYLVVLSGTYAEVKNRLQDFVDANGPRRVELGGRAYYPKMILGITVQEENLGLSFSRLEFAARQAAKSASLTMSYVPLDLPEFSAYQTRRSGLRVLRRALNNFELGLFAQPIVSLHAPGPPRKFEMLLRHYQDEKTVTSPLDILTFAAFNDVTQDLDIYVVELLCRNFHRLFGPDGNTVDTLTINISGPSFVRPHFAEAVIAIVKKHNVPFDKLVLEVTEDVANTAKEQAISTMKAFRKAGFQLALDDIGTGSSNFRTLHEFPVDYFKIDRSYCEEIADNPSVKTFVQLVIDIGQAHGKPVIAEGIPDEKTSDILRSMGADFSQSFVTGRPVELIKAPKFTSES